MLLVLSLLEEPLLPDNVSLEETIPVALQAGEQVRFLHNETWHWYETQRFSTKPHERRDIYSP